VLELTARLVGCVEFLGNFGAYVPPWRLPAVCHGGHEMGLFRRGAGHGGGFG